MKTRIGLLLVILAAIGVAAGCGSSDDNQAAEPAGSGYGASPATTTQAVGQATVSTKTGGLGTYLADADGRTLYLFEKDTGTTSTCSGACASAWPPFLTTGAPSAAGAAKADLIGTTTRDDDTVQVTYAGHPLYYYSGDSAPGDTKGQDVEAFGAEWYALGPSGQAIEEDES
jgi:predicted lipoprotein with Yx(FWY)xxD motif